MQHPHRPSVPLLLVPLLALLVPMAPAAAQPTATVAEARQPAPAKVTEQRVPAVHTKAAVAELPEVGTSTFSLVGVTWKRGKDDADVDVSVRVRTGKTWAKWQQLEVDEDGGDVGRAGTEPLWVDKADGVAVRVRGHRPADLRVTTVNAPAPAAQTLAADEAPAADGSPTFTPKPAIRTRSSWGARPHTYCDKPQTGGTTKGVIVHHTAGSNSYSASQSASIVRAIQAYHMNGRDWCDIGYNFLVDKYGQIFEGRFGGVDLTVRGAHAGNKSVNTDTMGVSMMGTFTSTMPSSDMQAAMVKLIGWRLGTFLQSRTGTFSSGGKTYKRISGHRNVVSTACPGTKAYGWLSASGGLRDRVVAYASSYSTPISTRAAELGSAFTGPTYRGERDRGSFHEIRMKYVDIYDHEGTGTHYTRSYTRTEYRSRGEQSGPLGFPTTDRTHSTTGAMDVQRFEHGSIYQVDRGNGVVQTPAMWGVIEQKYIELGEGKSALGRPSKGMTPLSNGRFRVDFNNGSIYQNSDGSASVRLT
ncbi:N-acetylmuramoyl-L-alanine amidase [Aeromicrobium terrae]|uniref:Peptidoglycan recognition protein family domain-containing protein n=1 Tax=Aeromicrobium terrae TaxID=2498846 RepID=A0A5C8NG67_9ACTN|nr:N-acetylmuramoyl-L-alanine amidase [Aeromicrobium terrae]TXL57314.1 hypothetical protein FHP06_14855 [Aeromicrobium terrae]